MLRDFLGREGIAVGRRHVATLMKRMGIEAIYRRRNTSNPAPGHKIYPYLLRGMTVERPNQVWATDITYIPMARGFVYLVAVVDWFTRRVLSHRVSITMEAGFCVEALEEAIGISIFSIVNAPIRALTGRRRTRPTSPRDPLRPPHEISAAA
jgi:putative transposase